MAKKKKSLIPEIRLKSSLTFFLALPAILILALGIFLYSARQNAVTLAEGCQTADFSGVFEPGSAIAQFSELKVEAPSTELLSTNEAPSVLGVSNDERWIQVDLSEQKLTAWEGNQVFLQTPISTGLPWWPTPTGEFRIWIKLKYTKMEGGSGRYYYNLPNVPYVMFFEGSGIPAWKGYGLHGTYWHNDFGTQRSHGCVNLPTPIAEKLFYWTTPIVPDGRGVVRATGDQLGTRIVIHD